MRNHLKNPLLVILCVVPLLSAWTSAVGDLTLAPESRLWISGTSSVRGFECTADSLVARVTGSGADITRAVLAGQKAVKTAEITVAAAGMNCHNGTMNGHMLKALKATEFPSIVFKMTSYDVAKGADGVTGTVNGELTLGGVKKSVAVVGAAKPGANGAVRFTGSSEVRMTEFGLKPPSLMFGTMKVNELVKVNVDLLLHE